MENIKIYVSCHKECFVPKHSMIYPIQVGAVSATKRFDDMLHDDEGINISEKNKKYCELTGQYWAWKNDDADYYGFFHYRRYLSFSDKEFEENPFRDAVMNYLTEDVVDKLNLSAANWVLQFSIVTFVIGLISVPYNAAIIAHEKMSAFALGSILKAV